MKTKNLIVAICLVFSPRTFATQLLTPVAPATPSPSVKSAPVANVMQRHQTAIEQALKGDAKGALQILKALAETSMSPAERDRVMLTTARVHYQLGEDQAAVAAYNQVRKGGTSWLEALEERSSSYMRMGRPQDALASLKTVLTPIFKDQIMAEPYYLAALAQLRVCDFKGVFRTLDLFKERFRDRVKAWEASVAGGNADVLTRVRLDETRETIQKLNLLEAEAIQRVYMDEGGKHSPGSVPKIVKGPDQLSFPMDPDSDAKEVWVDEVDDYRVNVKGCPTAGPAPDPKNL